MKLLLRWVRLAAVAAAILVACPSSVAAHPLGNFTINRYTRVEPSAGVVRFVYVLDVAEIPTFQDQPTIDANPDAYAAAKSAEVTKGLSLRIDGRPAALTIRDQRFTQPIGQGNLPTARLALLLEAEAPPSGMFHDAVFADANEPDRAGWREIVASAAGEARITESTVPDQDVSEELRNYPEDMLQDPLDVRAARFRFDPGSVVAAAPSLEDHNSSTRRADRFADLVTRTDLHAVALLGMAALAFGFGAAHALGPGHGKSVMAAYLAGTRGRPRDAIALGVIVAVMHTGSVLLVGALLLQLDARTDLERIYPVMTLLSGLVVVWFGASLAIARWRKVAPERRTDHDHDHGPGGHSHDHDHGPGGHSHDHGPGGHSHDLPADVAPLSRRGLLVLAGAGGIIPSPSAIVVLVSGASLGRLPLALSLIAVFSLGLAATLTVVGLTLVYGRNFLERQPRTASIVRLLPIASALGLIVVGVVITLRGLSQL